VEEQVQMEQSGVEEVPAAEVQETETAVETQTSEQVDNSGVEQSEVAAQNDEKGFAKALKAREEQIRAQLEQEYGGKAKEAERYQQMLDRTARFYGFDNHDEYMTALEQAEQDRLIQQEAEKMGVPEEVIREHMQPMKQELSEYKQKLAAIEEQEQLRKIEAEIQTLSSRYSDFDQYKQQVFDLAGNRGYSLEDAYKIATYEDRMNAAANQARQETIRNLQQNAETSTGSLGADAPEQASGYLAMSREERRAFKERVKSGKI
jgi:cupin superfamily acireductone dioxygenase involved in methionine salvage